MIAKMQWTDATRNTLRAAVDRIIPQDDFPAAWEAGAGDYIDHILSGDLQHLAAAFLDGLAALEAESQARFGETFSSLAAKEQDEILRDVETGAVKTAWKNSPAEFFRVLLELTSEGYYSDPGDGGNRGMISWRMIGFDPKGQMP
jgi:hypothetical protein